MIKGKYILLGWVHVLLLLSSCAPDQQQVPVITVRFDNSAEELAATTVQYPGDSVKRDIPDRYRDPHMHHERQKVETALKLGSLENGFQGQQIRIDGNEYEEYKHGWNRLLVFTNKGSWTAEVYYIRYAAEDDLIITLDSLQYQKHTLGQPKSGWSAFMDSLKHFGLFTLPDYRKIPGYEYEATHELTYDVEIATDNTYRVYRYLDPRRRARRFAEAKKFVQVLELVKRQFSLPQPWTPIVKPKPVPKKDVIDTVYVELDNTKVNQE